MSEFKDIGRRLREADPAAGAELDSRTRSQIRRTLVRSAVARPSRPLPAWALAVAATATALVAVAIVGRGLLPTRPTPHRPTVARESAPCDAAPRVDAPVPLVASTTAQAPPARPPRAARHPIRAVASEPASSGGSTRIMFTAPGGTRILWFVARRIDKEDAS